MTFSSRLRAVDSLQVADDEKGGDLRKQFSDMTVQLVTVGTIALVGTCIRVWSGIDVIQTQVSALARSDNEQDARIEQVRGEINTMRVQLGVLREIERRNTR